MIAFWRARYLEGAGGSLPKQLLVIEGSGRIAKQLQDEFPDATVTAVDDAHAQKNGPLKALRHREAFPVNETMFNASTLRLLFGDDTFDAVLVPFAFSRLCSRDDRKILRLIEECCRVARSWVLVADDETKADSGSFDRWKAFMISEWGLEAVYNGELCAGAVPDHYLSPNGDACPRRYFILRAFKTTRGQDFGALVPGETVEILTARRNWRPATITAINSGKVKVAYSVPPHTITEELPLSAGHLRRMMTTMAQATSRGVMPLTSPKDEKLFEETWLPKETPPLDTDADDLVAGVVDVAMVLTADEDPPDDCEADEDSASKDPGAEEPSLTPEKCTTEARGPDDDNDTGLSGSHASPDVQPEAEVSENHKESDFHGSLRDFLDTKQPN
jgi:hypothetical protein